MERNFRNLPLWLVLFFCIISVIIILVPIALNSIVLHEAGYIEGWFLFHSERTALGQALYDADLRRIVNYTYVSFYITGCLEQFLNSPILIARSLSWLGFATSLYGCWRCGRHFGRSALAGTISVLLFAGLSGTIVGGWLGTADPQFMAEGLTILGLTVHVVNPTGWGRLCIAPVLLVLAIFTKQQSLALPLAVLIDVAINHRR